MKRTAYFGQSTLALLLSIPGVMWATPTPGGGTPTELPSVTAAPTAVQTAMPTAASTEQPTQTSGSGTETTAQPTAEPGTAAPTPTGKIPTAGDLYFTELAIAPNAGDGFEFVEIYNNSSEALSLNGCILIEGSESINATCDELGGIIGNCDDLLDDTGTLLVPSGAYLTLNRSGSLTEQCALPEAYDYSNALSFANTKAETIALYCPQDGNQQLVFEFTHNWPNSDGSNGQTYQLDGQNGEADPTDTANWCATQALDSSIYCTTDAGQEYGSPGAANDVCPEPTPSPTASATMTSTQTQSPTQGSGTPRTPTEIPTPTGVPTEVPDAPIAGDLYFTELAIAPNAGDGFEFVEIYNAGREGLSLNGCILIEGSEDISATCDDLGGITGNCDDLVDDGGSLFVGIGQYLTLHRSGNLKDQCGLAEAYDYGNNLSFANTKAETIALYCPQDGIQQLVAEFTHNWPGAGGDNGQTYQYNPDVDDDPFDADNWCPAEISDSNIYCTTDEGNEFGSPGSANGPCAEIDDSTTPPDGTTPPETETPGTPLDCLYPEAGQVFFTELMIDPPGSGERLEFMELFNSSDINVCLEGCVLIEGSLDVTKECDLVAGETGDCDLVEADSGFLALLPQEYALLTQTDDMEEICGLDNVVQDYNNSVSMANTVAARVALYCPNEDNEQQLITEFNYNWKAAGGEAGQSLTLDPAHYDAPTDIESWCPVPTDDLAPFCETEDGLAYGSPGTEGGSCPPPVPRTAIDDMTLVFSEIIVAPQPSTFSESAGLKAHEWIEWVNTSDQPIYLNGCYLEVGKTETEGTEEASTSQYYFPGTYDALVGPSARQVLAEDGCLASDEEGLCLDVTQGAVQPLLYDGLAFSNSSEQYLSLFCLDEEDSPVQIDRIVFNLDGEEGLYGRSLQLQDNNLFAENNDDTVLWCPAPLVEELIYMSSTVGPNWGSPGYGSVCDTDDVIDPEQEGCGCHCRLDTSARSSRDTASHLALILLGFAAVRRRPRH